MARSGFGSRAPVVCGSSCRKYPATAFPTALWFGVKKSGAEGDRTPDLRAASATLSQLSYGPVNPESILTGPGSVNAKESRRADLPSAKRRETRPGFLLRAGQSEATRKFVKVYRVSPPHHPRREQTPIFRIPDIFRKARPRWPTKIVRYSEEFPGLFLAHALTSFGRDRTTREGNYASHAS